MNRENLLVDPNEAFLVTGSNGFIGTKVVEILASYGFGNIRCFVRPSSDLRALKGALLSHRTEQVQIIEGNLLSRDDCRKATQGVSVIYHLAAGMDKSFSGAFANSVVTTRNLIEGALQSGRVKRFVNVSSFAVYSNVKKPRGSLLDETCEIDGRPDLRYDTYAYAKVKQDELVMEYGEKCKLPYVIVRPSVVFGPGKVFIPSRVGIDTFGIFLHLGGPITMPLTYVDNCAEAIVLAGIKAGINREVFNIVDDDLPTSRELLKSYKKNVRRFPSVYIPYRIFYAVCSLWEWYSRWSKGQLPPIFNRRKCAVYWKGNEYSNLKLKQALGWRPRVNLQESLVRYFAYQKKRGRRSD
jgi:nucleoside-diphosphate-sugar epimerase